MRSLPTWSSSRQAAAMGHHVLDRSLGGHKHRAHVDGESSIEIFQLVVVNGAEDSDARVVHQNVDPAQFCHRAVNRGGDRLGVRTVGLNRQRFYSKRLRSLNYLGGSVG